MNNYTTKIRPKGLLLVLGLGDRSLVLLRKTKIWGVTSENKVNFIFSRFLPGVNLRFVSCHQMKHKNKAQGPSSCAWSG